MPESRFTHTNGINIHYLDWRGGGPTIVCLHGLQSQAHTWDRVAEALSPQYRVLALDLRGHGDSEKPPAGYRTGDFAADVEGFAQALGLDRFVLMGHSLGARIAAYYAGLFCDRLIRLVLEDPAFPLPPLPPGAPNPVLAVENARPGSFAHVEAAADFLANELDAISGMPFRSGRPREAIRQEVDQDMRQRADGAWEWRYSHRAVLEIIDDIEKRGHAEIMDNARNITVPVLAVRGGESRVCTPESAHEIECAIPNCRLATIPEVGHSVHGNKPAEFVAAVREFLG